MSFVRSMSWLQVAQIFLVSVLPISILIVYYQIKQQPKFHRSIKKNWILGLIYCNARFFQQLSFNITGVSYSMFSTFQIVSISTSGLINWLLALAYFTFSFRLTQMNTLKYRGCILKIFWAVTAVYLIAMMSTYLFKIFRKPHQYTAIGQFDTPTKAEDIFWLGINLISNAVMVYSFGEVSSGLSQNS